VVSPSQIVASVTDVTFDGSGTTGAVLAEGADTAHETIEYFYVDPPP